MAYISATELTQFLPQNVNITPTSAPLTDVEVLTIIGEISAELDSAAAAAGYAVPLTPPASGGASSAFLQMQRWTKMGAGWQVLGIIFPSLPGAAGGGNSLASDYRDAYQAALLALRKGETPLVGAPTDESGGGRELPRSYSTSNPCATAGVVPQIEIDRVW